MAGMGHQATDLQIYRHDLLQMHHAGKKRLKAVVLIAPGTNFY